MMQELCFDIIGEPVGKQRPHFVSKARQAYTPKKTKEYEKLVQISFLSAKNRQGWTIAAGNVSAEIVAYYKPSKAFAKRWPDESEWEQLACTKKPDADNVAKSVLDALNGLAYVDDKQVSDLAVHKRWSSHPRVEVKLKELSVTR